MMHLLRAQCVPMPCVCACCAGRPVLTTSLRPDTRSVSNMIGEPVRVSVEMTAARNNR